MSSSSSSLCFCRSAVDDARTACVSNRNDRPLLAYLSDEEPVRTLTTVGTTVDCGSSRLGGEESAGDGGAGEKGDGGDSTDSMDSGAAWWATQRRDTQLIAAIQSPLPQQSVAPSRQLPTRVPALPLATGLAQANFVWGLGEVNSEQFILSVRVTYSECVH